MHRYMKKFFIVMVIFAGVCSVFFFLSLEDKVETQDTLPQEGTSTQIPTFSWSFEEARTLNPDGSPQTHVYLLVSGERNLIDTVDGNCSEIEGETYEADVSNTGKVQCYYAGLGQQYRIVKDGDAFVVERKLFEESLPDVTLPGHEWEVVTTFK